MLRNIYYSIKLLFRKDQEFYRRMRTITGYAPNNIALYREALSPKSMQVRDKQGTAVNNERLEFLGDAILGAVVADIVYKHFPTKPEGFLTTLRSRVVERAMLGHLAEMMGITAFLHTPAAAPHNSYVGGNAFEALVGALYLDRGYRACYHFVEKDIFATLINLDALATQKANHKSQLLEWAQKRHIELTFTPLATTHSDNGEPIFEYVVTIGGITGGRGKGFTKKEAQQGAAAVTMKKIRNDKTFVAKLHRSSTTTSTGGKPVENGGEERG